MVRLFGKNDEGSWYWDEAFLCFIERGAGAELARRIEEWRKNGGEIV